MAKDLTTVAVANAKPRARRIEIPDGGAKGLYLIVQPSGARSWALRYRLGGQPKKLTLGSVLTLSDSETQPEKPTVGTPLTLAAARKLAADALHQVSTGKDPGQSKKAARLKSEATAANTLKAIAEEYLRREGKKLRSAAWRRRVLERLVYPTLGPRPISSIRRSDIIRLLDLIEDERGPVMADRTLALLRKIMNWHAVRDEDFASPIVRGMARIKPAERARERILADDELRAVWATAASATGPFGAYVRFLLLTGARRSEAAAMTRDELSGTDWTLPAARNKTKVDLVRPLSKAARELLVKLPGEGYVFSTTEGKRPLSAFSKFKRGLDKAVLEHQQKADHPKAQPLPHWTLHDLRRTARSLMSRAGVDADHAERCLGHVIVGVRKTYDRHEYHAEKEAAFAALAAQIDHIINPQAQVVKFPRPRRA